MKKIVQHCVHVLILTLALGVANVYGNAKWRLQSLDIQVPVMVTYSSSDGGKIDSGVQLMHFSLVGDSLLNKLDDSLFMPYFASDVYTGYFPDISYIYATGGGNIHFIFDKTGVIRNFSMGDAVRGSITKTHSIHFPYTDEYSTERNRSIELSDLICEMQSNLYDTTIVKVFITGKKFREKVVQAHYDYTFTNSYQAKYYFSSSTFTRSYRLVDDTTSYRCDLTFLATDINSTVQKLNPNTKVFAISTSLPEHQIHFSFPSSDHPQQMSIYDILGREVSRVEIPAGSSSYQMSSVGYPKGTYFARLGLQTASFVVN